GTQRGRSAHCRTPPQTKSQRQTPDSPPRASTMLAPAWLPVSATPVYTSLSATIRCALAVTGASEHTTCRALPATRLAASTADDRHGQIRRIACERQSECIGVEGTTWVHVWHDWAEARDEQDFHGVTLSLARIAVTGCTGSIAPIS